MTKRNRAAEQLATTISVLTKYNKNEVMSDIGAALSLYQSLYQAKNRTIRNKFYVGKGIEFKFNQKEREALIEVIEGDSIFWNKWIAQQEVFEESGFDEKYRPSLHRIDPAGHYEFGNIDVMPLGLHRQEHAKSNRALVFREGNLIGKFKFDSKKQFYNEFSKHFTAANVLNLKAIAFDTAKLQQLNENTFILLQTDSIDKQAITNDETNYYLEYQDITTSYYDPKTMELVDVKKWRLPQPIRVDIANVFIA